MIKRDGRGCGLGDGAHLKYGDGRGDGRGYGNWCGYGFSWDAGGRRDGDGYGYGPYFIFGLNGAFHDGGGICNLDDALVAVLKEEKP